MLPESRLMENNRKEVETDKKTPLLMEIENDLKGGSITPPEGRFPANLLLECTCEKVIEGTSEGVVINKKNSKSIHDTIYKLGHSKGEQEAPRAYKDTGTTHTDSNCPCFLLNMQSGITQASKTKKSDNRTENNNKVFRERFRFAQPR